MKSPNHAMQRTAGPARKFAHETFNIEIRNNARFPQRWLSSFSLDAQVV
jgi:hypothetical protein